MLIKNLKEIIQIGVFIFSSQIGTGLFILPALLSGGGYYSVAILSFVGFIAIVTIHVFASTGLTIYSLVEKSFGKSISNILYFIYWFISWFGTIVSFKELIGYWGIKSYTNTLELVVWFVFTFINLWKVEYIIYMESLMTSLKLIPYIFLLVGFFLKPRTNASVTSIDPITIGLFVRCIWCFIGIETGNIVGAHLPVSPSNRKKGTYIAMVSVVFFYVSSVLLSFLISGNVPLYENKAPYITILQQAYKNLLCQSTISYIIQSLIILTLFGSINSWTISSGYVTKECSDKGILPKWLGIVNKYKVPYVGITLTSLLVLLFLIIGRSSNIYNIIVFAIDLSCVFFLLIYGFCLVSYGKSFASNNYSKVFYYFLGFILLFLFFKEGFSYCF